MSEVMKNIKSRRSCRAFTDCEITKEALDQILEAGIYAPSGKNRQSWRFTVLRNRENIQKLAKTISGILDWGEKYNFYDPKVFVLVSNERDNRNGEADCAVALENMFLAAEDLGIGSCWINQLRGICDEPEIRELLDSYGIPANHLVWGCAALGYAAKPAKEPVKDASVICYVD